MIDATVFTREMALLHERFGRTVSKPVVQRYYDTLKDRLTTPQFEAAARYVFDHDQWWPAPMRFIEVVHGNPKARAQLAWNKALRAAERGEVPALDETGMQALRAAGGVRQIGMTSTGYDQNQLKAAFVEAFMASERERAVILGLPAPMEEIE